MAQTGHTGRTANARRAVTIRDVARRAGVSTATVSRTLANPDRVTEKTRALVYAAIRKTGFTPNATARNLRARSTRMVLALLSAFGDRFFNVIMDSIDEVLTEANYGIIYGASRGDPEREAHYARLVRSRQVDGVLLLTGTLPEEDLVDSPVPITLVCKAMPGHPDMSLFAAANEEAAAAMTSYLIAQGHARIAHVTGPPTNSETYERIAGYRAALCEAGLPVDESLIWEGEFSIKAGERAARRFLDRSDRPTAVFAANDEIAVGFIRTVEEAGLSVPVDVSVAGFDDIEYAGFFNPALTTVRQPRVDIGRLAAEDLVRRMRAPTKRPLIERLACSLVIRDSVNPLTEPGRRRSAAGHNVATDVPYRRGARQIV